MGISANFQKGVRVSKVTEGYKLCEIQDYGEEAIYSVLLREKRAELNHYTFWTHIASEELQHMTALIWYGCDGDMEQLELLQCWQREYGSGTSLVKKSCSFCTVCLVL